jgi:hypothetical protein
MRKVSPPAWGSFYVQDGINKAFGFGIYSGTATKWVDADGYLPAQITTFHRQGATIAITEFADQVMLGGNACVAVYSRVAVTNPTNRAIAANPDPSASLINLSTAPTTVKAHRSVVHDYVLAVDRFGNLDPWPSAQALVGAGNFDQHFAHMRTFWNSQLAQIAQVQVPRCSTEQCVQERVHLHPDCPKWKRPEHRRQRL